jgi:hypothetical protein
VQMILFVVSLLRRSTGAGAPNVVDCAMRKREGPIRGRVVEAYREGRQDRKYGQLLKDGLVFSTW